MNKVLLDRTPLWEIRPEEQVIPDINSLQVDNAKEQAKLYYEANKEEIWANTLLEKDKEIDRLKNDLINLLRIIDKNCDDLEATEEEFDSLDRTENLLKELKEGNNKN